MFKLIRTNSKNKDFQNLVNQLDSYLKITDGDEHEFYNQFNSIANLEHVIVGYHNDHPISCGAFKQHDGNSVEIKRMFTLEHFRRNGLAQQVLEGLETWAKELNYDFIVLETGIRQNEAVNFYKKNHYKLTPNYGQYVGVKNSLCFKKKL